MSKVEKIVCQGINFVVRDSSNSYEDKSNGFSVHAPFIWSTDEASVKSLRNEIRSEIDHGKEWDILREDKGFITSENRFVDHKDAIRIALDNDQVKEVNTLWDIFENSKSCTERDVIQETIYNRTSQMLERGLLPGDLY